MFANKMNGELSIVVGLVIFIVLLIMYNKSQSSQCDKYVTYFDKMYYDLPIIKTKPPDNVEGMNEKSTGMFLKKYRPFENMFDTSRQRWAGNGDSKPGTDNYGRRVNQYGNKQFTPLDRLNIHRNKVPGSTNFGGMGLPTHTEPFADDDWLDADFSYTSKYNYRKGSKFGDIGHKKI